MSNHTLVHVCAWIIYIFFQVITLPPQGESLLINSLDVALAFLSFIGVFYVYGLYIFPRFLQAKKWTSFILSQVVLLSVFLFFHYALNYKIFPIWEPNQFGKSPTTRFLFQFMRIYVYYALFGAGYWALYNYWDKEKKANELEKSLLEAELSYLKYQFNPHFLYNSLSLIHSKAYPLSPELSRSILLLAEIMRYALEGKTGEKVPLHQEIQYLENFIELHRMRFTQNFYVSYTKEGEAHEAFILPLVCISLVENAFKHGELNNEKAPVVIQIKIEKDRFECYTANRKSKGIKEASTGIGLTNIRRRLELTYGDEFSLTVDNQPENFATHLVINNILTR